MNCFKMGLLLLLLLSGCVTTGPTPEQLGHGRFAHMYTQGNNLIMHASYNTPLECEMGVRNMWSSFTAQQVVPRCSADDESAQLKYRIVLVQANSPSAPIEVHFGLSELCDATAIDIQTKGVATIETHCK